METRHTRSTSLSSSARTIVLSCSGARSRACSLRTLTPLGMRSSWWTIIPPIVPARLSNPSVAKAHRSSYVFEPRQGTSYGRNRGILTASAPLIAFTDDDVRVPNDWASVILTVFAQHPEVSCVGGKVLPSWSGPWPSWLTREHWSPLALVDYGESPVYVNAARRLCLIGANVAYRRNVFDRIGMFSTQVQTLRRELAPRTTRSSSAFGATGARGCTGRPSRPPLT